MGADGFVEITVPAGVGEGEADAVLPFDALTLAAIWLAARPWLPFEAEGGTWTLALKRPPPSARTVGMDPALPSHRSWARTRDGNPDPVTVTLPPGVAVPETAIFALDAPATAPIGKAMAATRRATGMTARNRRSNSWVERMSAFVSWGPTAG